MWEKVRGNSLDIKEFWRLPYKQRESIRAKFKKAYRFVNSGLMITSLELTGTKEVLSLGYKPILATPSKIILDRTRGDKYHDFVMFILVLASTNWDR
ncbi:hypothetical protein N7447_010956 [Penicillium robsamsonii]|uniref:uncharacterized protein n=1 Tax=Penicillium robsamsonii TaxID=1792511 RepID=UPI002547A64D|nr:uncharacterized protein N7447_010956 [Penicillium robsamsonii]KAJ5807500.1 hypothetical protein N7447_010956 [Penicillium robsamsonii]